MPAQCERGLARETIKCGSDGSAHRDVVTTELWCNCIHKCIHIPVTLILLPEGGRGKL